MDLEAHALVNALRGIYAIVGADDAVETTRAVLAGGCRIVQYRAKERFDARSARSIRSLTREAGAAFIVNDDWRAALELDADGVHLGPDDLLPAEWGAMREALGGRMLLGLSCGTLEEARLAEQARADYIGAGCVFSTRSKSDAGEPIGLDGLRAIVRATPLPVAAIGGITIEQLASVKAAGAAMAAVISAICDAPDRRAATAALVERWDAAE